MRRAQGEMMQFSDQASVIGIMSVEGYHAGAIRELLIRQAYDPVLYNSMLVTNLTAVRATTHAETHCRCCVHGGRFMRADPACTPAQTRTQRPSAGARQLCLTRC